MATQVQAIVSTRATDLTDAASLAQSSDYRIEAQGGAVRLYEAASAPDLNANPQTYLTELVDGTVYWHSQGTDNLYAWATSGACRVSINDAE